MHNGTITGCITTSYIFLELEASSSNCENKWLVLVKAPDWMEQGGPCVCACDSVWQHERPWSGTLKSQSRLCGVARERHESLVHSCVGVGAFVELKMLFWPKTLNRKHGPLFFSSAAFVCAWFFFFPCTKGSPLDVAEIIVLLPCAIRELDVALRPRASHF